MTNETTAEDVPQDVEEHSEIPVDESNVARSVDELVHSHPLVDVFGDSARILILVAIYTAPEPLNPTRIIERAGLSPHSWYDNKEPLLESGLVVKTGMAGNSPLYAVPEDDERIRALDVLSRETVEHQLDDLEE